MASGQVVVCDTNVVIFLAMKTAQIKSRKGPFRLESTDSRIPEAHQRVSSYRQRGVPTLLTMTVIGEFGSDKVRDIIDKKCGFLNYAQRAFVIRQVMKKRDDILRRFASRDIPPGELKERIEEVTRFYSDPARHQVLQELSRRKGRNGVLPEYNDRVILSECRWLKDREGGDITLLTDDGDFTAFSQDIREAFGIAVESI